MGVQVAFSYSGWQARYPEFAAVTQPQAQAYFAEATLYLRNDGLGPVNDATQQLTLLNMLTAHIAALYAPSTASGSSPATPPGRISNASEGSVSAAFELNTPQAAAWYAQTKYGVSFWAATAPFRTMHYVPPPCVVQPLQAWVYPTGPFLG